MFDRGAGTRRRICGAKCRDYQKLDALFLISLIPTHDQDRCAGAATAGRISEVARRDTAKYLPRLQPSPRARLSLGSATIRFAAAKQITKEDFEFQMLYGVRTDLQRQLVRDGYRVRIYIPFGHDWFPYFMRRLAERPANVAFFLRNFLR